MKQVEYLQEVFWGQLGMTQEILNGTADDKAMLNYNNRVVGAIVSAIVDEMKRKLRQFIDELYDNYVGIHLKSKKFIDNLNSWGHIMSKEDNAD